MSCCRLEAMGDDFEFGEDLTADDLTAIALAEALDPNGPTAWMSNATLVRALQTL